MSAIFDIHIIQNALSLRDLTATIDSIRVQSEPRWCITVHCSAELPPAHINMVTYGHPRIRTTQKRFELSDGSSEDFVLVVEAGTSLVPTALASISDNVGNSTFEFGYGDSAFTLPGWSPRLYSQTHYLPGLVVLPPRRNSPGRTGRVLHYACQLTSCSTPRPLIDEFVANCFPHCLPNAHRREQTSLAIVIPTAGAALEGSSGRPMISDLVTSCMKGSSKPDEIVVVGENAVDQSLIEELCQQQIIKYVAVDGPFNFSRKCNVGFLHSSSDVVLFLNDDMLCLSSDWQDVVLDRLSDARIGAVSGLLVFPDGTVQSAGHSNHPRPHLFAHGHVIDDSQIGRIIMTERESSGLSGALLATRRDVFNEVGGFCEALPSSYNDVDYCFKVQFLDYDLLYTPTVKFVHYESATRDPVVDSRDIAFVEDRWGHLLNHDDFSPEIACQISSLV